MAKRPKAGKAKGESGADPAMVRVRLLFKKSGLSLVDLGRRMGYSEAVARQAVWQFLKAKDPRLGTLRKFAEAIGVPLDEITPEKEKRMTTKRLLSDVLEEYGCDLSPVDFRDMLEEQRAIMFPAWTIDETVCHPTEAMQFCDHIRSYTECPDLPDHVILKGLMNARRAHRASDN